MDPGQHVDPGSGVTKAEDLDPKVRSSSASIGRALGGNLPCYFCGYNLSGLSIRGVCPECGANVKATILAVVDPEAASLRPIRSPRLVAGGLLVWSLAGLGAAALCWIAPLNMVLGRGRGILAGDFVPTLVAMLVASALGAAMLVRPHAGIPRVYSVCVCVAVAMYAPLAWSVAHLLASGWPVATNGVRWTLIASGSVACILLLLRPMARVLVARSLLIRSGRVDRQTLYGMAAAAGLIALGDGLVRLSDAHWVGGNVTVRLLGAAVLVVGASLLTLGLVGSAVDCARIARAIITPPRTVRDILRAGVDARPPSGNSGVRPTR